MIAAFKLFLFVASYSLAYGLIECAKYTCKTADQVFLPETCAYQDNITDIYYARKCANPTYQCVSDGTSYQFNYTCKVVAPLATNSQPGEWCDTFSDCIFSTACEDGICQGTPKGQACDNLNMCQPGTYCNSNTKVCTAQIEIGETGCTGNDDCVNNGACNITSNTDPSKNKCLLYRSFKVHDPVGQCNSGYSLLCPYVYCAENADGMFYCTDLFSTANGLGAQCDVNERDGCGSNEDSFFTPAISIEGDCTCGFNPQGISYCSPLPGDAPYKQYMAQLAKWAASEEIFSCSSINRFDANCVKTHWDKKNYNMFVYYQMQTNGYQWYINAQDCVMEVFADNYLKAKSAAGGGGDNDNDNGNGGNDSAISFVSFSIFTVALIAH